MLRCLRFNYWRVGSPLVVYLTHKSLRILQVQQQNNCFIINKSLRLFIDKRRLRLDLIRKKIKSCHFKNTSVALVIADTMTLRKTLKVSQKLNQQDLYELARIETSKYLVNQDEKICFDYKLNQNNSNDYYDMLIVATKTNVLSSKIKFLNSLGLEINCVDIESNCILRVANNLFERFLNSTDGGLDSVDTVFESSTALPIAKIPIGLALHKTLAWFEIGEGLIKTFVVNNNEIIFLHEDNYFESYLTSFAEILMKLDRSLLYYYANSEVCNIEHIYLSGVYPLLNNLREALDNKKNVPINIVNHSLLRLKNCIGDAEKLAIPFGMALSYFKDK